MRITARESRQMAWVWWGFHDGEGVGDEDGRNLVSSPGYALSSARTAVISVDSVKIQCTGLQPQLTC